MIIMKLRDRVKGRVGKGILIGLFVALFGGVGISRIVARLVGGGMEGVALVNGIDIPGTRFQKAAKEADDRLNMIRRRYGKNADAVLKMHGMSTDPQEVALAGLIQEELMNQVADKMNISLAPEYLEARLGNPSFVMNEIGHLLPSHVFDARYGINAQALMDFLKTPQMRNVERTLEEKLRRKFALSMMQSSFYLPDFMVEAAYKEAHLAKQFEVQTFSLDAFIKKAKDAGVTDEALKQFYTEQNRKASRYVIPEKRTGVMWTFSAKGYGVSVTEKEIQKYYNEYKRTRYIQTPTQFKVREIVFNKTKEKGIENLRDEANNTYQLIKADPSKFAEVAKKVSQNETASKGGMTDFFKRGTKDKAYEKAVVRLKADGDISPVTQTADGGFVILQRVGRKEATYQPMAKVKDAIVKSLTEQKFRSAFSREADRAVKSGDRGALDKFIKSHGGVKKSVDPLERSEDPLARRLFVLKEGKSLSFFNEGVGTILMLDKKIKKETPKLETLKDRVKEDYFSSKATKALEKAVTKAREKALDTQQLFPAEGSKISSSGFIKQSDSEKISKLSKEGYPYGFMALDWQGAVVSSLNKDGAVILRLKEIEKIDTKLYEEQKRKLYKQAYVRNHGVFEASYIASLYRNATIKINDQLSQLKDSSL